MPPTRRIVAGISGSPGNLPALRHAADLARVYDAALTFVHAWLPSGPVFAAWQFPSDPLVLQWQDDAWQRMWHALDTAFGGLPPDLEAESLVTRGDPGPILAVAAWAGSAVFTAAHAVNDLPGGPAVNQLNLHPATTEIARDQA